VSPCSPTHCTPRRRYAQDAGHCVVVRRDTREKETVKLAHLTVRAAEICEEMQVRVITLRANTLNTHWF